MLRRASPGRWPFFKLVKKREACKRFFLGRGQERYWQFDFAGAWSVLLRRGGRWVLAGCCKHGRKFEVSSPTRLLCLYEHGLVPTRQAARNPSSASASARLTVMDVFATPPLVAGDTHDAQAAFGYRVINAFIPTLTSSSLSQKIIAINLF